MTSIPFYTNIAKNVQGVVFDSGSTNLSTTNVTSQSISTGNLRVTNITAGSVLSNTVLASTGVSTGQVRVSNAVNASLHLMFNSQASFQIYQDTTGQGLWTSSTHGPIFIKQNSGTNVTTFATSGNVGFNTTNPLARLHVVGDAIVSQNMNVVGAFTTTGTNTLGNIITTGGNVGIATATILHRLDVNGGIRGTAMTSGNYQIGTVGSLTSFLDVSNSLITNTTGYVHSNSSSIYLTNIRTSGSLSTLQHLSFNTMGVLSNTQSYKVCVSGSMSFNTIGEFSERIAFVTYNNSPSVTISRISSRSALNGSETMSLSINKLLLLPSDTLRFNLSSTNVAGCSIGNVLCHITEQKVL